MSNSTSLTLEEESTKCMAERKAEDGLQQISQHTDQRRTSERYQAHLQPNGLVKNKWKVLVAGHRHANITVNSSTRTNEESTMCGDCQNSDCDCKSDICFC